MWLEGCGSPHRLSPRHIRLSCGIGDHVSSIPGHTYRDSSRACLPSRLAHRSRVHGNPANRRQISILSESDEFLVVRNFKPQHPDSKYTSSTVSSRRLSLPWCHDGLCRCPGQDHRLSFQPARHQGYRPRRDGH